MAKDLIYYFDNDLVRHELGEIQSEFNQSFVIDGTKDSAKVEVYSFDKEEIMPYTIIYHSATNTWWIVSHDKVERYNNENGTFVYIHSLELYGAIELLNARDLNDCGFSAYRYTIRQFFDRLLQFSTFEFKNNYNFSERTEDYNLSLDQEVGYLKTFQNYTLLSAIREFLDGYNSSAKLYFIQTYQNGVYKITGATFDIIPKTGLPNVEYLTESFFNDSRETKTIDKNSYGTTVISNAENTASTNSKTYPAIGFARLSSNSYLVNNANGIVRLPSNVSQANWIQIIFPVRLVFRIDDGTGHEILKTLVLFVYDYNVIRNTIITFVEREFAGQMGYNQPFVRYVDEYARKAIKAMTSTLHNISNYNPLLNTFVPPNDGNNYRLAINIGGNPNYFCWFTNNEVANGVGPNNYCIQWKRGDPNIYNFNMFSTADHITKLGSYYYTDYHSNNLTLFYFEDHIGTHSVSLSSLEDVVSLLPEYLAFRINYVPMANLKIKIDNSGTSRNSQLYNQIGKMSDGFALSKQLLSYSKTIESDNITKFKTFYDKDSIPEVGQTVFINNDYYVINNVSKTFYQNEQNQNATTIGYFVDCEFTMSKQVAVKSLFTNPNSIIRDYGIPQEHNINRPQIYRDFYELDLVADTKATTNWYMPFERMVNFNYEPVNYADHKVLIKVWWTDEESGTPVQRTYYYQLDTTTYMLKKTYYEVMNIIDNNIIGYDFQNAQTGFDISRIFTTDYVGINTPISYVRGDGFIEGIELAFIDSQKVNELYTSYAVRYGGANSYTVELLIPARVFIDQLLYEPTIYDYPNSDFDATITNLPNDSIDLTSYFTNAHIPTTNFNNFYNFRILNVGTGEYLDPSTYTYKRKTATLRLEINTEEPMEGTFEVMWDFYRTYPVQGAVRSADFVITEPNYNKDPIEVPVFEYSCQVDDTPNVLIGENIMLNQESDLFYAYVFEFVDKNIVNELNWLNYSDSENLTPQGQWNPTTQVKSVLIQNAASFRVENGKLYITLNNSKEVNFDTKEEETTGYAIDFNTNKDLMIYRYAIQKDLFDTNQSQGTTVDLSDNRKDLLFIVRNLNNATIDDSGEQEELELAINYYKVE